MTGFSALQQVDELVTRSHSDGVTELAAAALIEHDAKFLLIRTASQDLDTPPAWDLPAGPVLPGETVVEGLHRILAQALGYSDIEITGFLGPVDIGSGRRTFVFSTTVAQPDSICWTGDIPHRWIDNITISDLIPEINHVLRAYYALDFS
ncbi:NUDIX domain-containing protein [Streptomyces avermitilis]|uniref:NUDIX hydrolase n=1 Tax=Streptomyces avermitilis TaxID=33903 RepID=UPI0033A9AC4D